MSIVIVVIIVVAVLCALIALAREGRATYLRNKEVANALITGFFRNYDYGNINLIARVMLDKYTKAEILSALRFMEGLHRVYRTFPGEGFLPEWHIVREDS